jgi:uncharacterized protein (TIGR03435 family)
LYKEFNRRFTEYLSRQFDQPVIDKTGLEGDFSFTLHWVPDVNPPVSSLDVFGPAFKPFKINWD